jgi:hypothetical protein
MLLSPAMSDRGEYLAQVDRLCASEVLHGSESLCRLLRYLAQKEIESAGVHVKEYQIATEVYGRPADFNPQVDSTIRVQAARLRSKLSDYYSADGLNDSIVVDLPRGSYSLQFRRRAHPGVTAAAQSLEPMVETPPPPGGRKPLVAVSLIGLLVIIAVIAVASLRDHAPVQAYSTADSDPTFKPCRVFWSPFLKSADEPLVIYSNGAFVGRPETGMRYFDPTRDSKSQIWDHYTGVGEVLAIHELDQIFGDLHHRLRVKRGSLFSLDDANNNDLIFVGSPSENLKLLELPSTHEFVFQRLSEGPRKGDLAIVNVHPLKGEPTAFVASPSGTPLTEDYALVALMPGIDPTRSVMMLAGTTTFGTQAAVEYVCRRDSIQKLLKQLSASTPEDMKPFEAVVRVKIGLGVPVGMELAAVRARR